MYFPLYSFRVQISINFFSLWAKHDRRIMIYELMFACHVFPILVIIIIIMEICAGSEFIMAIKNCEV